MPKLGMEALCLMITGFLIILFFNNSKLDRRSRAQIIYSRLLFVSFALILTQAIVVTFSYYSEYIPKIAIGISLGLFIILLLCDLFIVFLYTRYIINLDLPDLKKIGNWTTWVIVVVLLMAIIVPSVSFVLSRQNNVMAVNDGISVILIFLIVYELLIGLLFFINRKYINPKRKSIILLGFISQLCCFMFQYRHQNMMFFSLGIAVVVLSFYMTLENEDVKLIDQLNVEKDKADKANAAKSNFIANVSHEIRTPINAVLGMDEMILRETHEESTRQYAYDIKSAAQTLHGIINEILDLSKMESGKMEIIPVNYNMRSLLNDTVNMIQFKADDKNLQFDVEADPNIPAGYVGDEIRIKQILTNILSNAVKYTEKGRIVLRLTGKPGNNNDTRILHFEVEDTGIGMKKEDIDNISQAYMRFEAEKNRNVEGTGLGMTITMQLLDMMDSKLDIESEYGRGTRVSFDLLQPVWDEAMFGDFNKDDIEAAPVEYEYEKSFEAPQSKVLVVDDNAMNRKVFRGLLKETRLIIDEAESGEVCINMVRKNKYDIVFMDHMMPYMDGIETFRNMKTMEGNMSKDAPVIMLTANAVGGAKELYLNEGFDDFIAKPIVPEELEKMIKKYLKL
ncbi:MAG: response regulator [Lachnospiraceae bacterium]|nr:response regulator [Lachnospiraceae bacterium]